jgi:hypothetical protein
MSNNDKTWELNIRVRVTTMSGWEPDHGDIEEWLENGGTLELVAIKSVQEAK